MAATARLDSHTWDKIARTLTSPEETHLRFAAEFPVADPVPYGF